MTQPITDYASFFAGAKQAVMDAANLADQEEQLKQETARLEKALEAEKKSVEDSIGRTVKKRQEEITSSYDKEIAKGQDNLKKARAKREKAKSQGMKERIVEETAELNEKNRELKVQMKTVFQQSHVPGFCNSGMYYSLFYPRQFSEWMHLLLTILVCFLAIPCGIYLAIPERKFWYLILIYFLDILIVGGLYMTINNKTKMAYGEALKNGRNIRDQIHGNRKKIKVITSTIVKDRSESVYNLEKYDDEIAQIEQELSDITTKKRDALSTFEKVTKTIISDEIAGNGKAKIDQITVNLQQASDQLKQISAQNKEKNLEISDRYESYLGRENLTEQRIDALADIMKNGTAMNITEAIQMMKNG